jgi:peptidoglycan/LPS O-acetylase OafA/YrhL
MATPALALNNLRGLVILIVIAFHSVLAYLRYAPVHALPFNDPPYQWRSFPIVDSARWFGFDLFCALQDLYLISLMFFLSGLFVWRSLVRKGAGLFFADRLRRLGLPFALAVIFLMPLAHYPVYRAAAVDPGVGAYWRHLLALPFWPNGPEWFLSALLILDFTAIVLFKIAPSYGAALGRVCGHPAWFVPLLFAASAAAYVPLALAFTPSAWLDVGPLAFQVSRPLHYAVYFYAGIGVGAYGLERGLLEPGGFLMRRWRHLLTAAVLSYVLWLGSSGLVIAAGAPVPAALQILVALSFVLACGAGSLCALALAIRFADRRLPALEPLNENAYGLYLIHYVFVVWLQYSLLSAPLPGIVKGVIVACGTLLLSLIAVAALGRIPAAARIIGMPEHTAQTAR